jgi:transcriptional regulator with XRE-family HTH domain
MKDLKDRIDQLVSETGLTNTELAKHAGCSRSAVAQWRGKGATTLAIKMQYALALQKALGYSAQWLFDGSGPKKVQPPPDAPDHPPTSGGGSLEDTVHPYSEPRPITWGELMEMRQLPEQFTLAMPDDALAPTTPRGTGLVFDTRAIPTPGAGVLVQTADGRRYVRRYGEGLGDDWEAQARNPAFVTLQSRRDGLQVLAVVVARHGSEV